MAEQKRGFIQVYTGNGKGKTTAALGLAFRAAGYGVKTFVGQFMKGRESGEIHASQMLHGLITIEPFGSGKWILPGSEPDPAEFERARRGLKRIAGALASPEFGIVVMDEVLVAVKFKLLTAAEVLAVVRS